jgi:cytochrome c oxidase subunit 2
MKRVETLALVIVLLILIGVPAAVLSYRARGGPDDGILVVARTAERGGFQPSRIVVRQGQRVRLRILAEDVTHGFQLLHFGIDAGAIKTGTITTVEFTADRVGDFPFYCSVRCSPLHMALMGTLVVEPGPDPNDAGGAR